MPLLPPWGRKLEVLMEDLQSHFLPNSGGISSTVTVCKAKQMACEASVCYAALPRRNACQVLQKFTVTLVCFCLTRAMLQSLAFTLVTANYSPSWSAFSLRQGTANWCCALNQHHPSVWECLQGLHSWSFFTQGTWHFLWRSPCSKRKVFSLRSNTQVLLAGESSLAA